MRARRRMAGAATAVAALLAAAVAGSAGGQVPPVPTPELPLPGPTASAPAPRTAASAVTMTMEGPERAAVGNDLPYRIVVVNEGPDTLRDAVLTNPIPPGTVLAVAQTDRGTCTESDPVECDLGDLEPGAVVNLVVAVTPVRPGVVVDQATMSARDVEPVTAGDSTDVSGPACTVVGTAGQDTLTGGDGRDVVCGLAGADHLEGAGGDDMVVGGSGEDIVAGGPGTDLLYGGAGADSLLGGEDDDYLDGGEGTNALDGGPGANTCVSGGASCESASPTDGRDRGRLDVRRVGGPVGAIVWRIETRRAWSTRGLWDEGYLLVFLDTRGDARPDRYAMVRAERSRVEAELYRVGGRRDRHIGSLPARKNGRRAVTVRVGARRLDVAGDRLYFRWGVQTLFTGRGCRAVCLDLVPGAGLLPMPARV